MNIKGIILVCFLLCPIFIWGTDNYDAYNVPYYPGESLNSDEEEEEIIDFQEQISNTSTDTVYAVQDTVLSFVELDSKKKRKRRVDTLQYSNYRPNPNRTLWMALAFPGLGQINNRKYWKLPIVYGGVAGITYAITWNAKNYNDYIRGYRDYMDSNPNTDSYKNLIPNGYPESQWESYLEGRQSSARRNRDMSIIAGVIFYALTVVDAFVDASLADFDISPDLSMKVKPKLEPQPNTAEPSVNCAVQLKF